jgi:ABC-type multidrug transport system ATPase subunit
MQAILEIHDVTKVYKNQRGIRDIHLELQAADIYGLLGPNGAGKTTLLKLITGLSRSQKGSITLMGANIDNQLKQALIHVGSMIESADFHDFISASQYLRLVSTFYPGINEKHIDEVLELVVLFTVRNEKIKNYSTGMKQKLALAAAILPDPRLVILDEPTNGLDIEGTVMFRKLVKQLNEEKGTSFLISSHMIHELEQLCNRVGIMFEGDLMKEGYVTDLLENNQSLEQFYIDELQKAREGKKRA